MALEPSGRDEIDDVTAMACGRVDGLPPELADSGLGAEERTLDIHVVGSVEICFCELVDQSAATASACVVEHNVEAAELFHCNRHCGIDLVCFGDIAFDEYRFATASIYEISRRLL